MMTVPKERVASGLRSWDPSVMADPVTGRRREATLALGAIEPRTRTLLSHDRHGDVVEVLVPITGILSAAPRRAPRAR